MGNIAKCLKNICRNILKCRVEKVITRKNRESDLYYALTGEVKIKYFCSFKGENQKPLQPRPEY